MAKGKKTFTEMEKQILRGMKLDWHLWTPLQKLPNSMIIKNIFTGDVKVIEKVQIPS